MLARISQCAVERRCFSAGVNGHRKLHTSREPPSRERSDRTWSPHAPLPPAPESWALTARAAVGWIALESSEWRCSRSLLLWMLTILLRRICRNVLEIIAVQLIHST